MGRGGAGVYSQAAEHLSAQASIAASVGEWLLFFAASAHTAHLSNRASYERRDGGGVARTLKDVGISAGAWMAGSTALRYSFEYAGTDRQGVLALAGITAIVGAMAHAAGMSIRRRT